MEEVKEGILKDNYNLIQLHLCKQCNFLVKQDDFVADTGMCSFCQARTKQEAPPAEVIQLIDRRRKAKPAATVKPRPLLSLARYKS